MQTEPFNLFQSIGAALFALILVVVVGWFVIARIRNWMRADEGPSEAFTLEDLRKLHRSGQISDEEYERAKAMMIGSTRAPASKDISALRARAMKRAPAEPPATPPTEPQPPLPKASARVANDGRIHIIEDPTNGPGNAQKPIKPSMPPQNPSDPRTGDPS